MKRFESALAPAVRLTVTAVIVAVLELVCTEKASMGPRAPKVMELFAGSALPLPMVIDAGGVTVSVAFVVSLSLEVYPLAVTAERLPVTVVLDATVAAVPHT